jgi:thymidylate synthase (FAD)
MAESEKAFVPVLNCGFVEYVSHMGDDLTVVNAARVSFNKESKWEGDYMDSELKFHEKHMDPRDEKLIAYLAKHKHWTPFAHPQITLRIKAPIFVRTQLFKHKVGMVENEVSRRYVKDTPQFYNPEWRAAPTDGAKQGSSDFIRGEITHELDEMYMGVIKQAEYVYDQLILRGVAPEQARSVLPQGTYTEWWWTGSLSAFARIYAQRIDAHAQWEVQQYAGAISEIIAPLFPHSWKALTGRPT